MKLLLHVVPLQGDFLLLFSVHSACTVAAQKHRLYQFRTGQRNLADIQPGEKLTPANILTIRPGNGLHTMYYEEILGKTAKTFLKKGTPLAWELIQ